MKKFIQLCLIFLLIFSLCGCDNIYRIRFTLKPADYTDAESIENSAKVFQDNILPALYPMFENYECVKLGMYIQADMYTTEENNYKNSKEVLKIAENNFKSFWVKVCSSDDRVVFDSKNIKKAYFDTEAENTPLIFKLDSKGTAAFERETLKSQKQKLIIYIEDATIGEYTIDKWCADGTFSFYPDAVYNEKEQKKLVSEIMSCAGLSGKYEMIDKEVS